MGLINEFINYLKSENNPSKATIKNYKADVSRFIAWFEDKFKKEFTPEEVSAQTIDSYKSERMDVDSLSPLSARSLDRHLSSLRKFFTFLKLEGYISSSPFDRLISQDEAVKNDPWHLKEFKNFLYVYNASNLTIKNYIIDVRQFFQWAEEVTGVNDAWEVGEKDIFSKIDNSIIETYKERLLKQGLFGEAAFSPATVNRKLSSLRRYLAWANEEGLIRNPNLMVSNTQLEKQTVPDLDLLREHAKKLADENIIEEKETSYSNLPPIRLAQKTSKGAVALFDAILIMPLAVLTKKTSFLFWKVKGKPVFRLDQSVGKDQKRIERLKAKIRNLPKHVYAPLSMSTRYFPWYKKAYFHARYTRPNWYKRYRSYPISNYFNLSVLIIIMSIIGFSFYNAFIVKPGAGKPLLAAGTPVSPLKILSFQGRITDNTNNPITSATYLRFTIYNDLSATDPARLWEEVDRITPDTDGIFSILLGSNGAGGNAAACGGVPPAGATGVCGIPQALFAQNSALWLGVTVSNTPELTPRQQLATVAYATNAETLQGMPPITSLAAGDAKTNTVLALDSSGNLTIGGSTNPAPVFQATDGKFTLTGKTLLLSTVAGSNTNVQITPDGSGFIDLQKPLQNTTISNNIPTAKGSVEVDDLFSILATSSGQSALTINQTGTGPLISASTSGVAKFTVDSSGNTSIAGNAIVSGNLSVVGSVATSLIPTGTIDLGSSGSYWNNLYVNNIIGASVGTQGFWQRNSGALSPANITDDLLIGGISTNSGTFAFGVLNVAKRQPIASVSGNLIVMQNNGFGGNVGIGTTAPVSPLQINVPGIGSSSTPFFGSLLKNPTTATVGTPDQDSPALVLSSRSYYGGTDNEDQWAMENKAVSAGSRGDLYFYNKNGNGSWTKFPMSFNGDTSGATSGNVEFKYATQLYQYSPPAMSYLSDFPATAGGGEYSPGIIFRTQGWKTQATAASQPMALNYYLAPENGVISPIGVFKFTYGTNAYTATESNELLRLQWGSDAGVLGAFFNKQNLGGYTVGINGNVGIGTTNPGATLEVASGAGQTQFRISSTIGSKYADIKVDQMGYLSLSPTGLIATLSGTFNPSATSTYDLGSPSRYWNNLYVNNIYSGGGLLTNYWQRNLGSLSPLNITDDLLVGGIATNSSTFAFGVLNVAKRQPVASVSGNLVVYPNNGWGGNVGVGITNPVALMDIEGNTPGSGGGPTGSLVYLKQNATWGANNQWALYVDGYSNLGGFRINGGDGVRALYKTSSGLLGFSTYDSGATSAITFSIGNGAGGSSEKLRIDNNGNVGIGTTNPLQTLDVYDPGGATQLRLTSTQGSVYSDIKVNQIGNLLITPSGNNATISANLAVSGYSTASASLAVGFPGVLGGTGNAAFSGNVGIGTTNPQYRLDVDGTIHVTNCVGCGGGTNYWNLANGLLYPINSTVDFAVGGNSSSSANFLVTGASPNEGTLFTASVSGQTSFAAMVVDNSGLGDIFTASSSGTPASGRTQFVVTNTGQIKGRSFLDLDNTNYFFDPASTTIALTTVGAAGIGTTNPTGLLQVTGNTSINGLVNINQLGIGNIFTASAGGSTKFVIGNAGNVGIGTTSPVGLLNVSGTAGSTALVAINETGATNDIFVASQGGNPKFVIKNGGNVGIGTTSPTALLDTKATAISGREMIWRASVSDASRDFLSLANGTSNDGEFLPSIFGAKESDNRAGLRFIGGTNVSNDTGTGSLMRFTSVLYPNNSANPVTDTWTDPSVRPLFTFENSDTTFITISAVGNLGIGTTNPLEKLDVQGNASVSGNLVAASAVGTSRNIQSTASNSLIVGGDKTGNLFLAPLNGVVGAYVAPTTNQQVDLGQLNLQFRNIYAQNFIGGTSGIQGYWQRNLGSLSPTNITDDLLIGSIATNSSTFAFGVLNVAARQPIASVSGNLVVYPNNGFGGNVGIGTTAPSNSLQVAAVGAAQGSDLANFSNTSGQAPTADQVNALQLNWNVKPNAGNQDFALRDVITNVNTGAGGTAGGIRIVATGVNPTAPGANSPTVGLFVDGLAGASVGTTMQNAIQIGANWDSSIYGLGDLRVNATGNIILATSSALTRVGIGTNTPVGLLQISGNPAGNGLLNINQTGTGDIFTASVGGTTKFVIKNNGNVGIGTTLPVGLLNVSGSVGTTALMTVNQTNGLYDIFTASAGGTPKFTINALGNVGIGTTLPVGLLNVNGSMNSNPLEIINQTGLGDIWTASSGGTPRFVISNSGNVGIGTTKPVGLLNVSGTAGSTALITFNETGNTNDIFVASQSSNPLFVIKNNGAFYQNGTTLNDVNYWDGGTLGGAGYYSNIAASNSDKGQAALVGEIHNYYAGGTHWNSLSGLVFSVYNQVGQSLDKSYGVGVNTINWANNANLNNAYGVNSTLTFGDFTGQSANNFYGYATGINSYLSGGKTAVVSNFYGFYLPSLSLTGITIPNRYGVYIADTGAKSYFAGNVGIGTTNPVAALEVASPAGQTQFRISSTIGSKYADIKVDQLGNLLVTPSGNNATISANLAVSGYSTASASLAVGFPGVLGGTGNAAFSGNVGIGTTNPQYRLDVNGTINVTSCVGCGGGTNYWNLVNGLGVAGGGYLTPINSSADFLIGGQSTASAAFAVLGLSNSSHQTTASVSGNFVVMPNNGFGGNLGIGTTNPLEKLDVQGNASVSGNLVAASAVGTSRNIQSTASNSLIVGGDKTGNLFLAPLNGVVGAYVAPTTNQQVDLGQLNLQFRNIYAQNFIGGTSGIQGYWQRNLGSLSPTNITDDLLIGSIATNSSTFAFGVLNVAARQPIASVSGNLVVYPNNGFGGNVGIGTTAPSNSLQVAAVGAAQGSDLANFSNTSGQAPTADQVNALQLNWNVKPNAGNQDFALRDVITNVNTGAGGTAGGIRIVATGVNPTAPGANSPTVGLFVDGLAGASVGTTMQNAIQIGANWDSSIYGLGDLRVNATGNIILATSSALTRVGIGTNTPVGLLQISGNPAGNGLLNINQTGTGDIFTASVGGTTKFVIKNNGNVGIGTTLPVGLLNVSGSVGTTALMTVNQTNGLYDIFTASAGGTPKFTINALGNVGIGTTLPVGLLNVNGTVGTTALSIFDQTDSRYDVLTASTGGTPRFVINGLGNVGIGTTQPLGLFNVNGTINKSALSIFNQAGNGDILTASSGATTRFVINGLGNVGIGTTITRPVGLLNVNGTMGSTALVAINESGATNDIFVASQGGNPKFVISNSGNVGIGTTSTGTYALNVNGTGNFTGLSDSGNLAFTGTNPSITNTSSNTLTLNSGSTGDLQFFNSSYKITSGGVLTVSSCVGCGGGVNYWTLANGLLYPGNSTTDFAIGGNSTASANFTVTGASPNEGTLEVASISAQTSFAALVVDNLGLGDLITASSSGTPSTGRTQFAVTNQGQINAKSFYDLDNMNYFLNPAATTISLTTVGSVGIGTSAPLAKSGLDVEFNSNVNALAVFDMLGTATGDLMTASKAGVTQFRVDNGGNVIVGNNGSGKLTALTLDPLYTIDGARYSTYGTGMVGVKEEVTGKADLVYDPTQQAYTYTIGLNNQPQGSDLWLFSRVTDPDVGLTTVLLTPDSSASVWYTKDVSTRTITLLSNQPTSVSYRLTAPRFDYASWANQADISDPTLTGALAPGMAELLQKQLAASLSAQPSSPSAVFSIQQSVDAFGNTIYLLVDNFGHSIKRTENFSNLIVANIQAGLGQFSQITSNSINITSQNLKIGGQTLRDYIASVVEDLGFVKKPIVSPIADIDELHTNLITPLGQNKNIAIALKDNSLEIRNGASGSAVATIDNQGNASFSGTVNSNNLAVNNDATIGGTLHASKIIADQIEGLKIQTSTISANYITNNYYNSTSSADTGNLNLDWKNNSSGNNYIDISSFSGQMGYVQNLSADFVKVTQGLMVFGPTSLSDVSLTGQLSIGGKMILADTGINVLGGDLELQPLRQGGISFLSGLFRIDSSGNIISQGDAEFTKNVTVRGRLAAGILSPLADSDLNIALLQKTDQTNSQLKIQNSSGSAVLSINSIGDLISSGSGTFQKLNLSLVTPAYAISDTEVIATGSAGISSIRPNQTEITIDNKLVTDKSLIYITPRIDTNNMVLFLLRQVPGESFTVGVNNITGKEIPFNWIIVN